MQAGRISVGWLEKIAPKPITRSVLSDLKADLKPVLWWACSITREGGSSMRQAMLPAVSADWTGAGIRPRKGHPFCLTWLGISVYLVMGPLGQFVQGKMPFDGKDFHGKIAYSCYGNFNDPDDWAASPVALGILAVAGLQDKLVPFDYHSTLSPSDTHWEAGHAKSVLGAAEIFGFVRSCFFDCQKEYAETVAHSTGVINAATADSPVYLILAGPAKVPQGAPRAAAPETCGSCISLSRWNDGFAPNFKFTARNWEMIELGIRWVQIADQNTLLSTSPYRTVAAASTNLRFPWAAATPEEFLPYFWMLDTGNSALHFLWERLLTSTRPDPSDARMMYFPLMEDPEATPEKLRRLFTPGEIRKPILEQDVVRLEAENFQEISQYLLEPSSHRSSSHRLCAAPIHGAFRARLGIVFDEPSTAATAMLGVAVAYKSDSDVPGVLRLISGSEQKLVYEFLRKIPSWKIHVFPGVEFRRGEKVILSGEGNLPWVDYLALRRQDVEDSKPLGVVPIVARAGSPTSSGEISSPRQRFVPLPGVPLDNPAALPGQIIVAGGRPGHLKINGGRPLFLCGPDNPEDFLFLGKLLPDGTRDGPQMEIINFLEQTGVNAFHFMMFRMRRCNIKDEGDDTHCPFVDHDPSKPLNEKVLAQWEYWLQELEKRGIVVHLEFYNDATDVELLGWKLDGEGNLHPHERRFIEGIVRRFKHLKNIMWGLGESSNKLPRSRVAHFRKMAALIRQVDNYQHPIVQSFVTPETAERDMHPDGVTSTDYRDNPIIDVVTWLHIPPHGKDFDAQHRAYLQYA